MQPIMSLLKLIPKLFSLRNIASGQSLFMINFINNLEVSHFMSKVSKYENIVFSEK